MIQKITLSKFYLFIGCLGIILFHRFIPHPPNFTSLIALSFYIPAFLGRKYILALIFSFFITDFTPFVSGCRTPKAVLYLLKYHNFDCFSALDIPASKAALKAFCCGT